MKPSLEVCFVQGNACHSCLLPSSLRLPVASPPQSPEDCLNRVLGDESSRVSRYKPPSPTYTKAGVKSVAVGEAGEHPGQALTLLPISAAPTELPSGPRCGIKATRAPRTPDFPCNLSLEWDWGYPRGSFSEKVLGTLRIVRRHRMAVTGLGLDPQSKPSSQALEASQERVEAGARAQVF